MTHSSYLAAAARRASINIVTAPPMALPITETQPREYKRSEFYIARDQREAGIEHHEWERTPPLEPMWHSWLAGALVMLAIGIVVVLT